MTIELVVQADFVPAGQMIMMVGWLRKVSIMGLKR
jgi:hypothetical protein